ncbi:hypothetical protein N1851_026882 [Merluccius polli]|uniref:Uncharacterized protein n=1 Tax=Merluccius polli TaxID=89951 RepID=A0AA47MAZ7_MERPO|nr:hypothetical protein N1851_026882 [Merluccius polli]
MAGDFIQANMTTVFPHFHQYVNFATRGENTLDRIYSNIKWAFKTAPRPHLGSSDHLSVMLIPAYKPLLTRNKPTVKQVRVWPAGAMEALQDCFEHTDWGMFKTAAEDIQEYAESVSGYIQKYMEDVSVVKNITTRANEKPWMTIKDFFTDPTNPRQMWQGIQAIMDYKVPPSSCENNTSFLIELNKYFGRFEELNTTTATKSIPPPDEQTLCLDPADVRRTLRKVNARKAAGLDNIPGKVLKECADQLAGVLTDIFNISLYQAVVPSCFKTVKIVPVPKKNITSRPQ